MRQSYKNIMLPTLELNPDYIAAEVPKVLWIELTSKCPFDCIFCTRKTLRGAGEHIDFDLYQSLIHELRNPDVIRLNYAGESIHYPHLIEAIELVKGTTTELVSAFASLPRHQMERLVKSGLDHLTISLHTMDARQFKEIYRFSSIAQLKQKVAEFLRLREQLGQTKPTLDFAYVAMQQNLSQLESVAAYATTIGVTELFIHPVISRDPLPIHFDAELKNNRLKPRFKMAIHEAILKVTARYPNLHISLSTTEIEAQSLDAIPRYFPASLPANARIYTCDQNPWETVHILANGDVVGCEVRDKVKFGNLHDQSLTDIWHSEAYQQFRRDYVLGNIRECRECPYKMAYLPSPLSSVIDIKSGMSFQLLRGWYSAEPEILWSQPESLACLKKTHDDILSAGTNLTFLMRLVGKKKTFSRF
jgi:radical SAM protein with 4Fe4S-binding SPASM domain